MRGRARGRGARREGGHHAEKKGRRPREHAGDVGVLPTLRKPVPARGQRGEGRVPRLRGSALRAVRVMRRARGAGEPARRRGRPAPVRGVRSGADAGLRRVREAPSAGKRVRPRRARAGALPRVRRRPCGVRGLRGVVPRGRHGGARRRAGVLALLRAQARRRHLLLRIQAPPPLPPSRGRGRKLPRPGDRAGDGWRAPGARRASRGTPGTTR